MKRMDPEIRKRVFERDNYTCRYCGDKDGPFHADHVYPFSKGGETSIDNLVTACEFCNHSKHNRIGRWPKPIGYFEEHEEIAQSAAYEIKRQAALVMISLFGSGIPFGLMWALPNDIEWLVAKAIVIIWFGLSLYLVEQWLVDYFRS